MIFKKVVLSLGVAGYVFLAAANAHGFTPAQGPLFIGDSVPGNLVLVPSVEWPTVNSVANLEDNYDPDIEFVGYFDSDKCYEYRYSDIGSERHFYPIGPATNRGCFQYRAWSGNFMNWAATQTIDPFRKVLTGGHRVKDTPTETWLEKARHDGQGGGNIYPVRIVDGFLTIMNATPFMVNRVTIGIDNLGYRMRFRLNQTGVNQGIWFNPAIHPAVPINANGYDVAVRVAVCVPGLLEDNCVRYDSGYKPEGLIQATSDQLRFSVFGYLNQDGSGRDGAVLRSRQKFVGPRLPGGAVNAAAEWDASTGVFIQNPNPEDVADTNAAFGVGITRSGVINYLNQFGQTTNNNHKGNDPVSELFYAAVRYMRGEPNVAAYTDMTGLNLSERRRNADGFPVITDWFKNNHDPITASCQINVALGIGDVYTWYDKNLPGPTSRNNEPAKPPEVVADDWIDVVAVTNRVGQMEGLGPIGSRSSYSQNQSNSAYIAGLAYWANTTDMRPGSPGKTTMSTHWVDVLEARSLEGAVENQYMLAAKYGGADVPETFDPMRGNLQEAWWHTNGETLTPFGVRASGSSFKRPDNYYTAGNAADMVDSLSRAFETILNETSNVVAAVSTTSTRLDTETVAIQARFETEFWTGDLEGLDPLDNSISKWRGPASSELPVPADRNIFTFVPTALGDNLGSGTQIEFKVGAIQRHSDIVARIAGGANGQNFTQLIDFLRGDRKDEDKPDFRTRGDHVLGDIINSRPVLAGALNEGWARLPDNEGGGSEYSDYLDGRGTYSPGKANRTPTIYVGANDGMLHGFYAENDPPNIGGVETMAYIPYAVQTKLGALADPNYEHQFYVDGQIAIGDAYDGRWKNILVGGLGAGGRAIYAIDVTDPDSPSVLWELTHEDDPSIGYTFGEPVITRLENGTWVAIFGNGYGSQDGYATLQVRDLFGDGKLIGNEVELETGGGNGLSGVAVLLDPVTQTHAIRAYAGDLKGNMWRVDFNNSLAKVAFGGAPLFNANRPITATPALAASPSGGVFVYFGTGRLLETGDDRTNENERFWAVRDRNTALDPSTQFGVVTASAGGQINGTQTNENGWGMDLNLGRGERVVNKARVIFGRLIFTSFEPDDDPCATGGDQRLYVLDAQTGTGLLNDDQCTNCGVISIGTGAPVEPPVVLKPAQPPAFDPPDPSDPPPSRPSLPPGVDPAVAREGWCSEFGILAQTAGANFMPLGTLCDGRQVWRQPR